MNSLCECCNSIPRWLLRNLPEVHIRYSAYRVLKWWRHKKNFWNYGIGQDILKEQCPRDLLIKNEHFGANDLWDVSQLYSENSIQTQKKLERFVWSFLSITGLRSQRQFAPKCSFLEIRPLGHCSWYPDKSHNFRNFVFMTSHFSILFVCGPLQFKSHFLRKSRIARHSQI